MSDGEDLMVRGTALASVLFFALGFPWLELPGRETNKRIAWAVGWLLCLIHVLLAFHFAHHWSHAAAVAATARQTAEAVGLDWGGGVWVNYAFLAVWGGDAAWRSLAPRRYWMRSRVLHWTIVGFLAFIVFNATIVFGGWGGRLVGVLAIVCILASGRR